MGLSGVLSSDGGDRHRDGGVFPTQAVDTATDREEIIESPSQLRAPLIDDGLCRALKKLFRYWLQFWLFVGELDQLEQDCALFRFCLHQKVLATVQIEQFPDLFRDNDVIGGAVRPHVPFD